MSNVMELKFRAKLENEPFARTCVSSFVAGMNPTIDELIEIKTIVGEGVSNAIIHGYDSNDESNVYLMVLIDDQYIKIIIEDTGVGIKNVEEACQPMYSTKKEIEHAGMGLTIIQALSDSFVIESKPNLGTKLIIKKRLLNKNDQSIEY